MAYVVIVNDRGISQLIQVGDGRRWIKGQANQIERVAVSIAPGRTQQLRQSHEVVQERSALGRFQSGFRVSATARHAAWVHEGTSGMPGRWAKIPAQRSRTGAQVVKFGVKGQPGNPWLADAAAIVVGR